MDTGVRGPRADSLDHRNQSMELSQLVVARLEDFLLILGPLLDDEVEDVSHGKHGGQVWEESILVEGIVDKSTLVFSWATKLFSHDGESKGHLERIFHFLAHVVHKDNSSGGKATER